MMEREGRVGNDGEVRGEAQGDGSAGCGENAGIEGMDRLGIWSCEVRVAVRDTLPLGRYVVPDDVARELERFDFLGIEEGVKLSGCGHGKQVCTGLLGTQVQFSIPCATALNESRLSRYCGEKGIGIPRARTGVTRAMMSSVRYLFSITMFGFSRAGCCVESTERMQEDIDATI
jgi:hypothetical protein